jgi:hypothetical protein
MPHMHSLLCLAILRAWGATDGIMYSSSCSDCRYVMHHVGNSVTSEPAKLTLRNWSLHVLTRRMLWHGTGEQAHLTGLVDVNEISLECVLAVNVC